MRKSKDQYFMEMLQLVAERSTCRRRAVGAIVTDDRGIILATGYNGVPRSVAHCLDQPCPGAGDATGDSRRCWAVHAEQNALLHCHRLDLASTIYVTVSPCFTCAKLIAQTNIQRVICGSYYADADGNDLLHYLCLLYIYDAGTATIHRA